MKHPEVHGGEISNVKFQSYGLEDDKASQDFFRPSLSETQQTRKINKKDEKSGTLIRSGVRS